MQLNFGKLLILSCGFLILFSSYLTTSSLAGKVLKDYGFGHLGFYSLALMQFVFAFGCFLATPIVNKLGAR